MLLSRLQLVALDAVELAARLVVVEDDGHQVREVVVHAHMIYAKVGLVAGGHFHIEFAKTSFAEVDQFLEGLTLIHSKPMLKYLNNLLQCL